MKQGVLLERDGELSLLDEAIGAAFTGQGGLVMVEGPAGIGKTSLLEEALARAVAVGMVVVAAQGATLERDFGFGVVRQLFEGLLVTMPARERRRLLTGAAELAAPVVAPGATDGAQPADAMALLHGLYWLTANLADRAPLLIVIDDLHWSDAPSLLYVAYLVRRLEGLPVLVVGAVRTGDPEVDVPVLNELMAISGVTSIRPEALSVDGVRRVVTERLGEPDDEFVAACHAATTGVPFLVRELARALADDEIAPTAAARDDVLAIGPRTVARATVMRMARLSPSAVAVAEAVAILDRHAREDRIAVIAELDPGAVHAAQDALSAMEILVPGPPVRFAHPLVHRSVYDAIPATQRAARHERAAEILHAEGAAPEEVAAHLQLSAPAGRSNTVTRLRAAAVRAGARGAPASAVTYLRRALEESAPVTAAERARLHHELGRAEGLVAANTATRSLQEAFRCSRDPLERARIAHDLSDLRLLEGDWTARLDLLDTALVELGDRDLDLAARIEAARTASRAFDVGSADEFEPRLPRLRMLVGQPLPGARALALAVAATMAGRQRDHSEVRPLVERGLDGGAFLEDEGAESFMLVQGVAALVVLDELDAADAAVRGVLDNARRRGSILGLAIGSWYQSWIRTQRGELKRAEAHARTAFDLATEYRFTFALPTFLCFGVDVLEERPQLDDAFAIAETVELGALAESGSGAFLLTARARRRLLQGRREEAIADLEAAGEIFDGCGLVNPIEAAWRLPLARALSGRDVARARRLVDDELQIASEMGLARAQGAGLRVAGVLERGGPAIELLEESARVLEDGPSPLELARTQVELGSALRRQDHRVDARAALRAGLDLAERCGAERLAARAIEELQVAGARPRRRVLSGPESLTASEERVACMAADGLTNREIAEALFVTAKTVENQLGSVYRKLAVSSRKDLAGALGSDF